MAAAAAVVFALVAALPVPLVGARPLAVPAVSVAAAALVLVFFGKVNALSVSVPLPVSLSVHFDGSARAGARAFPLVTGAAVVVSAAALRVAVVMTGFGLEVGQ